MVEKWTKKPCDLFLWTCTNIPGYLTMYTIVGCITTRGLCLCLNTSLGLYDFRHNKLIVHLPNGLGYVAKGVHCGTTDCLLVGLQQVQQLKTDSHPLLGRHKLGPPVGNPSNQVNAILLHLLVPACKTHTQRKTKTLPICCYKNITGTKWTVKSLHKESNDTIWWTLWSATTTFLNWPISTGIKWYLILQPYRDRMLLEAMKFLFQMSHLFLGYKDTCETF